MCRKRRAFYGFRVFLETNFLKSLKWSSSARVLRSLCFSLSAPGAGLQPETQNIQCEVEALSPISLFRYSMMGPKSEALAPDACRA